MISSNSVYRSFSRSTTCMGVLADERDVKPTISEKYMVTLSNISARIVLPIFNCSAIVLYR